jgi:hypothetical protein
VRIPLEYLNDFHHTSWTPDGKMMASTLAWRSPHGEVQAGVGLTLPFSLNCRFFPCLGCLEVEPRPSGSSESQHSGR